MANRKISELSAAGALAGNELVEVVKGGANVQTTTQAIADLGGGGGAGDFASLTGQPTDNANLSTALSNKANAKATLASHAGGYTLASADLTLVSAGATLIVVGNGTGDLTVPLNASVAFPTGTMIGLREYDNVVATGGVTITGSAGDLAIPSGMTATLEKTGTNTWLLHNGAAATGGSSDFASLTGDPSDNVALDAALDAKAPLASPALTGTPTAPTAAAATNTTQIATTAFVQSNSIGYTPADELTEIAGLTLESDITVDQLLEALAIPVIIPIHADSAATMAITNMPSAITVLPNNQTTHYLKVNTNKIRAFRLCARVSTTSASANNPRMYIQYSINGGSSYVTLGAGTIASGDAISLFTGAGAVQQTNWITIPVEAKGDSFQWRVVTEGGDGAADPAVGNVFIEGKT